MLAHLNSPFPHNSIQHPYLSFTVTQRLSSKWIQLLDSPKRSNQMSPEPIYSLLFLTPVNPTTAIPPPFSILPAIPYGLIKKVGAKTRIFTKLRSIQVNYPKHQQRRRFLAF